MTPPLQLPIEIRGQPTVRDHLDALRVVERRQGSRWVTPVICLAIPAFFVAMSLSGGRSLKEALFVNLFWIVLGASVLLVLPSASRWAARSVIKGNPVATAPLLYRFTQTGFEERECPVEISIPWSAIVDAVETPSVLVLFTGRTSAFIVPSRDLIAAGQVEAIRALLRDRLGERAHLLAAPHVGGLMEAWPFENGPRTASITTRQVLEGGAPILLVTHDADDGCWQFLCGTTNESEDARLVGLGEMYAHDPTLGEVADLPEGWRAWRQAVGGPWQRSEK